MMYVVDRKECFGGRLDQKVGVLPHKFSAVQSRAPALCFSSSVTTLSSNLAAVGVLPGSSYIIQDMLTLMLSTVFLD